MDTDCRSTVQITGSSICRMHPIRFLTIVFFHFYLPCSNQRRFRAFSGDTTDMAGVGAWSERGEQNSNAAGPTCSSFTACIAQRKGPSGACSCLRHLPCRYHRCGNFQHHCYPPAPRYSRNQTGVFVPLSAAVISLLLKQYYRHILAAQDNKSLSVHDRALKHFSYSLSDYEYS